MTYRGRSAPCWSKSTPTGSGRCSPNSGRGRKLRRLLRLHEEHDERIYAEREASGMGPLIDERKRIEREMLMECVDAARLHVVIAGNCVDRDAEHLQGRGGQPVLRRNAIVGVVPRQDHEIEGGAEFHFKLNYDRKQVDEIPLCSPGEMKVANVSKGKRTLVSLIYASAPMSAVGVCGTFDAHAGLSSEANPTQRAIDTRAKLPRIMNIVG